MAILLPLQHTSCTYPPTAAAAVFFPSSGHRHNVSSSCLRYCQLSDHQTPLLSPLQPGSRTARTDKSFLNVAESCSEAELWAAANLCVRTFYEFNEQTFGIEFSRNEEDQVVVGTLDLNQCVSLPHEIVGMKPKINNFGYELMAKAKSVAEACGIIQMWLWIMRQQNIFLYMKSGLER